MVQSGPLRHVLSPLSAGSVSRVFGAAHPAALSRLYGRTL